MMGFFFAGLAISLALVAIAVIAAKLDIMEGIITPAIWVGFFVMSAAFLILTGIIFGVFKPLTLEELLMPYWKGFWSRIGKVEILALYYFFNAIICGFMFLVSNWIEDDDKAFIFKLWGIFGLLLAAIFAIGFFKFFEGVALILGIIGTIIGIFVGIKKLSER